MNESRVVFIDTYKHNTTERTCKLLGIDIETLEKNLKLYGVPKKKGKNSSSEFKIKKITKFISNFYHKHGFFPDVKQIQRGTGIPKQIIMDIMEFHQCKEIVLKEKFFMYKVRLHKDFCDIINSHARRNKFDFSTAFKSWTYGYVKSKREERKGMTYCFQIDELSLKRFKKIQDEENISSVELFRKLLNGYKGDI